MKTIESITQYISYIEKKRIEIEKGDIRKELLFRGQPIDRPLLPKLARLGVRIFENDLLTTEKIILEEFKRGITPLSELKPENNWDLLALAQHHGLPTRLLDWSSNALVALWFAVEQPAKYNPEKKEHEDGVVWILQAEKNDFRKATNEKDPLSNEVTKIFRSSIISRRISAQAGIFTVHKINEGDRVIKFETHRRFKDKLEKLVIPANRFPVLRKQLNALGINNSTIFPDIDGLCKHLQWKYMNYQDEILP